MTGAVALITIGKNCTAHDVGKTQIQNTKGALAVFRHTCLDHKALEASPFAQVQVGGRVVLALPFGTCHHQKHCTDLKNLPMVTSENPSSTPDQLWNIHESAASPGPLSLTNETKPIFRFGDLFFK